MRLTQILPKIGRFETGSKNIYFLTSDPLPVGHYRKMTMELIDIEKIDLSPFQHRRHVNADKLRELALSITQDGLIEPIILRPCNGRF